MPLSTTTRFHNCDVVAASTWNWNECPDHSLNEGESNPSVPISIFVPLFAKNRTTFVPIGFVFALAVKAMIS